MEYMGIQNDIVPLFLLIDLEESFWPLEIFAVAKFLKWTPLLGFQVTCLIAFLSRLVSVFIMFGNIVLDEARLSQCLGTADTVDLCTHASYLLSAYRLCSL